MEAAMLKAMLASLLLVLATRVDAQSITFSGPTCAEYGFGPNYGGCGYPVNQSRTYAYVIASPDNGYSYTYSSSKLSDLYAVANAPVEVLGAQVSAIYDQTDALQRNEQRLYEGISLSSALTVVPPNPGDRFSITFGGSGFNGYGAGAVTATARLSSNVIGFAGYARSQSENLFKGGVSFSIH
jgi:hypothetical protein